MEPTRIEQRRHLGSLIRSLRYRMGLTQQAFSRELGFKSSDSIVSNLECGRYELTRVGIVRLAHLMLVNKGQDAMVELVEAMRAAWGEE